MVYHEDWLMGAQRTNAQKIKPGVVTRHFA